MTQGREDENNVLVIKSKITTKTGTVEIFGPSKALDVDGVGNYCNPTLQFRVFAQQLTGEAAGGDDNFR